MDVDASNRAPWDLTCQTMLKSSINELKGVTTSERGERINDSLRFALSALQSSLATDIVVKQTGQEGSWHTIDIQCYLST